MYIRMDVCTYVCMYVCMYFCVYVYMYLCVYMYTYLVSNVLGVLTEDNIKITLFLCDIIWSEMRRSVTR